MRLEEKISKSLKKIECVFLVNDKKKKKTLMINVLLVLRVL